MSKAVRKSYVLRGGSAGKTVKFGGYQFVRGVLTVILTPEDHKKLEVHLSQWNARPDDGERTVQENGAGTMEGAGQPDGGGPAAGGEAGDSEGAAGAEGGDEAGRLGTGGGGQETELGEDPEDPEDSEEGQGGAEDPQVTRIRAAVLALDGEVAENWTREGKPALAAVERAVGFSGLTRAMVEQAAPGHKRPKE